MSMYCSGCAAVQPEMPLSAPIPRCRYCGQASWQSWPPWATFNTAVTLPPRGMYVDPAQVPTTLSTPATEPAQPPEVKQ